MKFWSLFLVFLTSFGICLNAQSLSDADLENIKSNSQFELSDDQIEEVVSERYHTLHFIAGRAGFYSFNTSKFYHYLDHKVGYKADPSPYDNRQALVKFNGDSATVIGRYFSKNGQKLALHHFFHSNGKLKKVSNDSAEIVYQIDGPRFVVANLTVRESGYCSLIIRTRSDQRHYVFVGKCK